MEGQNPEDNVNELLSSLKSNLDQCTNLIK